jgi:hypothetical protein
MITTCRSDQSFGPIHTALLHLQRLNLYRVVRLGDSHKMLKFCETINDNNALGAMVVGLEFVQDKEHIDMMEMDQPLKSMLPKLINLGSLYLEGDRITQSTFDSFAKIPAPSSLTYLRVSISGCPSMGGESVVDLIVALLPASLEQLYLEVGWVDPDVTGPTIARIALNTPRRLRTLEIWADFKSQAVCNLIASTESTYTELMGSCVLRGLDSLRNSEVMKELVVMCEAGQDDEELDESLLKLTNLTRLTITACDHVQISNHFFTDYFTPELPLQFLELDGWIPDIFAQLVAAFKSKPFSLNKLVLDTLSQETDTSWGLDLDWVHSDLGQLLEMCERGGVEVSGSDLSFVERVKTERLLGDSDDEVDDRALMYWII